MDKEKKYIPALRFDWLTGVYDKIISLTMPEKAFRNALITSAFEDHKVLKVLEFGMGTASNSILAKERYPYLDITGIDVDINVLRIAQKKIRKSSMDISIIRYDGVRTDFSHGSFEVVISSLVFHHLLRDQKINAFNEIQRLLVPGGKFVFVDWGKPQTLYAKMAFTGLRLFDGWSNTADNASGHYLKLIEDAGFLAPKRIKTFNTIYGSLELIETAKLS